MEGVEGKECDETREFCAMVRWRHLEINRFKVQNEAPPVSLRSGSNGNRWCNAAARDASVHQQQQQKYARAIACTQGRAVHLLHLQIKWNISLSFPSS